MKILESIISNVVVFTSQAVVVRQASVSLEKGEHTLVFDKLPFELIDKSIQVKGQGNATLGNIKSEIIHFQSIPDTDVKYLLDEKQKITDRIQDLTDKIKRLLNEKEFIESINRKITTPVKESNTNELKPEDWLKMLLFYKEKSEEIDNEIRQTEKLKRTVFEKYEQLDAQSKELEAVNQKRKKQVSVILEMHEEGELTLELNYLIGNASWKPVYDLRVDSQAKTVAIHYQALIQQQTTENWENIHIKISTAQPQISGRQPETQPWRINLQQVQKKVFYTREGEFDESEIHSQNEYTIHSQRALVETDTFARKSKLEEKKPVLKSKPSTVQSQATSVFFEIAGKHTVKTDGTASKVSILMEDFSGYFRYSSVPKLSPFAYLRAKVINQTEFPFLAGEANVFLDNNFVATSALDLVAPTEDFWTYLGIDEAMKVEHKLIKKFEKQEGGFLGKKTTVIIFEYLIKIKNYKKTDEEITIFDQLPISSNANLKVHLIEPIYKEDTETFKKTELNYLEWILKVKAGEEVIIPFKFSVEYPKDEQIIGI